MSCIVLYVQYVHSQREIGLVSLFRVTVGLLFKDLLNPTDTQYLCRLRAGLIHPQSPRHCGGQKLLSGKAPGVNVTCPEHLMSRCCGATSRGGPGQWLWTWRPQKSLFQGGGEENLVVKPQIYEEQCSPTRPRVLEKAHVSCGVPWGLL